MGEVVDAPNAKELISWINTGRNHAIWLFREHCSPEDVKNLATALKNSKTCTKLGLGFNSIAIDGAKLIANSLLTNNTLILLYLYGNDIEDDGAIALASMLKTNKTLKDLNVENNKIGIPGASAIGEALTVNKTLTWLSLESNKIMDAGAISICDALTVNNSLKYLSLSAAEIGDPTAESLGNALANNKSLRSLRIVNNRITHEGAKSIEHGMERNGSLHFLRISANNDIPQNYIDKLERLAEKENLRGFLHALQTTESAPWQRSKLMVVGEGRAGKTATVRSLLNEQFDPEWDSTIGVALTETKVDGSGKFENAGEESYLTDLAHRIAVGEYLNQDNEQEEMPMLQIPASNLVAAQEPIIEVETPKTKAEPVANKRKSEKRKSLKKEAPTSQFAPAPVKQAPQSQAIEQEFDHVFEYDEKLFLDAKKNKDAVRLSIWDYGGQEVFQTLHHLFLTQYGEYLLVFDMSLALKQFEMSMEYLKFWLSSIKIHANEAPVILVGTFLDSVNKRDNLNTLDKKIRENLKELLGQAVIYEASNLIFFPISNKSGDGIPDLKSSIKVTVESQPHVLREVSLKWMRSLDQLVQDKETNSYTKFSNFREMAKDVGIDTLNEVESMLALFHEMGIIFYFRETETLRDQIITNPQWLIDMISKVIRDSKIHPFANDEIKAKGLDGDVKLLFEQGLASRDLLEYLWTKDQADYLVDLMRHLLLLSEWKFGNTEVQYFVPAMIVQKTLKEDKITPALVCKMEFEILPTGAFERLVCLLVAYGMEETDAKPPELAKEAARIYLKDKDMITIKHKKSKGVIKGSFTNIQRAGRNLDILERMLRKIKDELMGEGFSWRTLVKFDKTDNKFKSLSHVKDKKLLPEGGQNDGRDLDFGSFLETF